MINLQEEVTAYYRPIAMEKIIDLIEAMKEDAILRPDAPDAPDWGLDITYQAIDTVSHLNMAVYGIDMGQFHRTMNPFDMIKVLFDA